MDAVKRLQSEKEENERLTYKEIIKNEEINAYLKKGNENLGQLGYTDHSQKHCMQVAHQAEYGALLANELLKETDMTGDFICTGICFPENCRSAADGGGEIKQNIA